MHSFTFQYVSINTWRDRSDLPSTAFTFQYVSINTKKHSSHKDGADIFTFQYVSINTGFCMEVTYEYYPLHSNMFLLIHSDSSCFLLP